ncbi:MAG: inorganic diphosphatase [Fimbriimonadaceae bacterium]|nr:inorganic diphosphatase [Fimbriimonadaceae bacterium]QYK57637.1 MAG: inorganic diphosphatase [Fimbriimonadaceae bacterium]
MSLLDVPIGSGAPHEFNVIIEIPRFSTNKYEMDPDTGVMRLDRVLFSPLFYPWDYGFVPQTKYLDGDPVDVLLLISHPTYPGVVVDAKPIGVLEMRDGGKPDEKVLCVASKDPRFGNRSTMDDVNQHTLDEIVHFFEVYKQLENKEVEVMGWRSKEEAIQIIEDYRLDR